MVLTGVNLLRDRPLPECEADFRRASETGFDYVEPNLGAAIERADRTDEVAAVRSYLDTYDLDLNLHLPWADIHLGTPRERVRRGSIEEIEAYLDIAADMGARQTVLHLSEPVGSYPGWDREYLLALLVDSVRELDAYAESVGVELTVENKEAFVTASEFPTVFEETEATMTFDTGHARVSGMDATDMAEFLETWSDRVSQVHLNDTRGRADEHLPLGMGDLDIEAVLRPLRETDWSGNVLLDLSVLDFEYVRSSKERLDAML